MKRLILANVTLSVASLAMVGSAWAETTNICVPEKPSKPVLSGSAKNECPPKKTTAYKTETLPSPAELEVLDRLLPHVKYVESGIGGKPTIQFSGVNVQIVDGEGSEETTNGEGNLVIGYDANPGPQTGSHNLVLGTDLQTFTSYGGLLGGFENSITAPYASVSGGGDNRAEVLESSVSGGGANVADGFYASVSGGAENIATGFASSIFGGRGLRATNEYEAIP